VNIVPNFLTNFHITDSRFPDASILVIETCPNTADMFIAASKKINSGTKVTKYYHYCFSTRRLRLIMHPKEELINGHFFVCGEIHNLVRFI